MMKKDKIKYTVFTVTDVILILLYIPLSLVSIMLPMASDGLQPDLPLIIPTMMDIVTYPGVLMFVYCIGSMLLSGRLDQKGRTVPAYIVKFIPIFIIIAIILGMAIVFEIESNYIPPLVD